MITKNIKVEIESGTDARATAMLVQIASQYKSSIHVTYDEKKFNAKSIMGMMTLGIKSGEEIVVTADGEDAESAIEGITKFLTGNN